MYHNWTLFLWGMIRQTWHLITKSWKVKYSSKLKKKVENSFIHLKFYPHQTMAMFTMAMLINTNHMRIYRRTSCIALTIFQTQIDPVSSMMFRLNLWHLMFGIIIYNNILWCIIWGASVLVPRQCWSRVSVRNFRNFFCKFFVFFFCNFFF